MKLARCLLWILLVPSCGCGKNAPPPSPPARHAAVVVVATRDTVEAVVSAPAEARPIREGLLAADAVGRIEEIREAGDRLASGDVVARLDADRSDANLEVLEAGIARAENDRSQRERDLARVERLEREGVASREEVENARWTLEDARRRTESARAAAREGVVGLVRRLVRAPYPGVVLERRVRVGEVVAPGQALVRFGDLSTLEIAASVGEADALRISAGSPARVAFDALPGDSFSARVHRVDRVIAPGARTAEVIVRLANPRGRLPAGLLARVRLFAQVKPDVLTVPAAALRSGPEGEWVWIVESERARHRPVRVGLRGEDRVEILEGLREGDAVVVRGGEALSEGALVDGGTL